MNRVLVATDGSEAADRAVDYAAGLAKREGADLLIANVIGGYGLPDKAMLRLTQSEQAWLKELLEVAVGRNADEGERARATPQAPPSPTRIRASGDVAQVADRNREGEGG